MSEPRHSAAASTHRQLLLDLGTPPPNTFDSFVEGGNHELLARLRRLRVDLEQAAPDRTFYLWGEAGSGRSHLLQALCHDAPPGQARFLGPQHALSAFAFEADVALYCVDDCDGLSPNQQIALFNLFNEVRAHPLSALVATGSAPPLALDLREDLRTRLGWGLVFQVHALDDAGKQEALRRAARARGLTLADEVPPYLLTHFRRDMKSLMALLDALDRYSLEQQRAVTLPLLRAMLARRAPEPAGADAAPTPFGAAADSDGSFK
jgi:DnaA-homolog protein